MIARSAPVGSAVAATLFLLASAPAVAQKGRSAARPPVPIVRATPTIMHVADRPGWEHWSEVEAIYQELKNLEERLVPPDVDELFLGTFDCRLVDRLPDVGGQTYLHDAFTTEERLSPWECGYRSDEGTTRGVFCESDVQRRPRCAVNGRTTRLRLRVIGDCATFTAAGMTGRPSEEPGVLEVDVGDRGGQVTWQVSAGGRTYGDALVILRTPYPVGAGAFTVPAHAVSIAYAPVVDTNRNNTTTHARQTWTGSSVETTVTHEESTSTPPPPTRWDSLEKLTGGLSKLADLAGQAEASKYLGQASEAIGTFQSAIGRIDTAWTEGTIETQSHRLTVRDTVTHEAVLGARLPAGLGDEIAWLQDLRVAWVSDGHRLQLTPLGWRERVERPVILLMAELAAVRGEPPPAACRTLPAGSCNYRSGPGATRLPPEAIESLLAYDPFVGQAPGRVDLATLGDRFARAQEEGGGSGCFNLSPGTERTLRYEHLVEQEGMRSLQTFTTQVTEYTEGLLSCVGIGPSSDRTVTLTQRHGQVSTTSAGERATVSMTLHPGTPRFCVYYDRLFGTFLFQPVHGTITVNPRILNTGVGHRGRRD